MKYKNLGTRIGIPYYKNGRKFCNIIATFLPSKKEGKFDVAIKLQKIVYKNDNVYKFERFIDRQPLSGTRSNIKTNITRVVRYAITNGEFDEYFADLENNVNDILNN